MKERASRECSSFDSPETVEVKVLGVLMCQTFFLLQDIDVSGDPADSHALYIVVHSRNSTQKRPVLSGKFLFEDHIRCNAAKTVLQRSRENLHHSKMVRVAKMLHLPVPDSPSSAAVPVAAALPTSSLNPLTSSTVATGAGAVSGGNAGLIPSQSQLSSTVLKSVFRPPSSSQLPNDAPDTSQNFEMSSLKPQQAHISLLMEEVVPALDSPVKLTVPLGRVEFMRYGGGGGRRAASEGRADSEEEEGTLRNMSATPEPQLEASSGVEDNEEALTSGGLFHRYNAGIPRSSAERRLQLVFDDDDDDVSDGAVIDGDDNDADRTASPETVLEKVCPLGLQLTPEDGSPTMQQHQQQHSGSPGSSSNTVTWSKNGFLEEEEEKQPLHSTEHAQNQVSVRVEVQDGDKGPAEEHQQPSKYAQAQVSTEPAQTELFTDYDKVTEDGSTEVEERKTPVNIFTEPEILEQAAPGINESGSELSSSGQTVTMVTEHAQTVPLMNGVMVMSSYCQETCDVVMTTTASTSPPTATTPSLISSHVETTSATNNPATVTPIHAGCHSDLQVTATVIAESPTGGDNDANLVTAADSSHHADSTSEDLPLLMTANEEGEREYQSSLTEHCGSASSLNSQLENDRDYIVAKRDTETEQAAAAAENGGDTGSFHSVNDV